jgi:hypothetical protein
MGLGRPAAISVLSCCKHLSRLASLPPTLYDLAGDLNVLLPSHENEYISRGEGKVNLENLLHSTIYIIVTG